MGSLIASITPGCATSSLIRPRFLSRRISFDGSTSCHARNRCTVENSSVFSLEGGRAAHSCRIRDPHRCWKRISFFFSFSFVCGNFAPFRSAHGYLLFRVNWYRVFWTRYLITILTLLLSNRINDIFQFLWFHWFWIFYRVWKVVNR